MIQEWIQFIEFPISIQFQKEERRGKGIPVDISLKVQEFEPAIDANLLN